MNNSLIETIRPLGAGALAAIFTEARTPNGFQPVPVDRETLREIARLAHLGPTAANANPMRIVFVDTPQGKARLLPALSPGNVEKTREAPVTAVIAHDLRFYEKLPVLFPHRDMSGIAADPALAESMSAYNAALQAAYVIIATRAFGLDAGPMGGFDKAAVDAEFFADGTIKSDLLLNIGVGNDAKLFARNPRLAFEDYGSFA